MKYPFDRASVLSEFNDIITRNQILYQVGSFIRWASCFISQRTELTYRKPSHILRSHPYIPPFFIACFSPSILNPLINAIVDKTEMMRDRTIIAEETYLSLAQRPIPTASLKIPDPLPTPFFELPCNWKDRPGYHHLCSILQAIFVQTRSSVSISPIFHFHFHIPYIVLHHCPCIDPVQHRESRTRGREKNGD